MACYIGDGDVPWLVPCGCTLSS